MSLVLPNGAPSQAFPSPFSPSYNANTKNSTESGVFAGVLTAIATPFTSDSQLDLTAFEKILSRLREAGTQGVVVAGTTGESPTLTEAEKETLVRVALKFRTPDFRIYVGTGSNSTANTVQESLKYAIMSISKEAHVDGVMAVVPYYNKPTQAGMMAHFSAVATALGERPLCLYNVPGRTGSALSPHSALQLFEKHPNIVAIKEAAGNLQILSELARGIALLKNKNHTRNIELLSGDDTTFAPALLCGATGVISVTTHIIPEAMVALWQAAREGNLHAVTALQLATLPVNTQLFCAPNPVPLKYALSLLGFCQNTLRLPLTPLEEKEQTLVKAALEAAKEAGLRIG
jgi:4-hydroxy-tetrahydrodipicolinate synthase